MAELSRAIGQEKSNVVTDRQTDGRTDQQSGLKSRVHATEMVCDDTAPTSTCSSLTFTVL